MGSDRTSFLLMEFIYFLFLILNLKKKLPVLCLSLQVLLNYLFILFLTILMHF